MDKTVYIKTKEFKVFNKKLFEVITKYEQCDNYDFEPINSLIMNIETDINKRK